MAVIVNDMSEVRAVAWLFRDPPFRRIRRATRRPSARPQLNVDAAAVGPRSMLRQAHEQLVAMQNGCICCTLREDLLREVSSLAKGGGVDYIVIESTGISEPLPVAETFTFGDLETGEMLGDVARLDTMVTVVDSARFFEDFDSLDKLADRPEQGAATPADERTIVDLLVDQVEFADVILLNKTDLVSTADLGAIERLVRKLNPRAKIQHTQHSKVPLKSVLNTGLFDFETAATSPGWLQELRCVLRLSACCHLACCTRLPPPTAQWHARARDGGVWRQFLCFPGGRRPLPPPAPA